MKLENKEEVRGVKFPHATETHEHCYHAYRGPMMMVIPDGHIVQKCCKCSSTRTVHADHAFGRKW